MIKMRRFALTVGHESEARRNLTRKFGNCKCQIQNANAKGLKDPAQAGLLALQEGKVDMGFAVGSSVPGRNTVIHCLRCSDSAGGHLGSWLLLGHPRSRSIRANDSVPISALMVPGYITLAN